MALLQLRDVSKAFGGLQVVNSLDLEVGEGEVVSLIGPNGAGKTTVFNLITGIFRPDSGEIVFEGGIVSGLLPHTITTRGIARTFQTLRLFLNMTVLENVMVATYGHTRASIVESMLQLPRSRREEKEIRKLAEEKLAFFGQRLMGYRWDQPAYSLSYANRRRLEIARAMATGARLLLLDEPAAGMNPVETHEMTELIGKLRDEGGYTILVIEHDMHVVEGISDRVVAQLADQLRDLVRLVGVHPGRRLVEEQQPRVRRHRAGDFEPAPVRVREAVRLLVVPIARKPLAEERKLLFGELPNLPLLLPRAGKLQHRLEKCRLGVPVLGGHHVLEHRHVQEQPQGLKRPGDPPVRDPVRSETRDLVAFEDDLARVDVEDAGDQVEHGRLPGAVRPDHADDLALVDMQAQMVDHL